MIVEDEKLLSHSMIHYDSKTTVPYEFQGL